MKNINIVLFISFLFTFLTSHAFAEDYKIGAVNTVRVFEQSPQAVTADALIKKEFSARDRELQQKQQDIKDMEERLNKDSAVMSSSERRKTEREIVSGRRDLKRSRDEFREDVNFRLNEVRADIQKEIFNAIVEVAKANDYDLVLFDGVAYASDKVDISDLVISYLKKKYKKE